MWNQHTYDVGTRTKDNIEMELLLNEMSWPSLVIRTPKQNSYTCTINLSQNSSLSSLSHNNYRQKRKKNDKVNEFIETMEKGLTNNTLKKLIDHNKPKVRVQHNKDQSVSESTSDKSLSTIQQNNSSNKQTVTLNDPEFKRLKTFTEIYNPTKHKTNVIGLQTENIDSLNETEQPLHHSPHNTTQSPNKLKGKRRYETSNKNIKTNLPNKTKQQKMTGFGFKCA